MEPFGKKEIFVGYNKTSKAYRIYILGKRYIEVSQDVTFHEEVAFRRSREVPLDVEMVEQEAPAADGESLNKPPSPVDKREESKEGPDVPTEEPVERLLEEILAKRKPTQCSQILQEAEGHVVPKGFFFFFSVEQKASKVSYSCSLGRSYHL